MRGSAAKAVRPRKGILALVACVATGAGLTPLALLLDRPWLAACYAAVGLVVGIVALRTFKTGSSWQPSRGEFVLAAINALAAPATVGLGVIPIYWAMYGVEALFGIQHPHLAWWVALVMSGAALASGKDLRKVARKLYPRTAGIHSSFYGLARFGSLAKKLNLVLPAFVAVFLGVPLALLFPGAGGSWWGSLGLAYLLLFAATPLERVRGEEERPASDASGDSVEARVGRLFEAAGFTVDRQPRTGRADIDPLLLETPDFYAQSADGERGYAVEVKRWSEDADVWKALSNLVSAAYALGSFVNAGRAESHVEVEPAVVVVGEERVPPALHLHMKKGLVHLVRVPDLSVLEQVEAEPDEGKRRDLACRNLLGLRQGEAAAS